jgi:hemerythrin superfamily protein
MNAVDLLIQDHQVVRGLFQKFQSAQEAEDDAQMQELGSQIFEELEVHTTIEEEIFYPAVRDGVDDSGEIVDESEQEHHVVDVLIGEMRELTAGSDDWVAKMTVLIENVEHHAEEEEQEMFPDCREQLGEERLDQLGEELEARQRTAKVDRATKEELYEKAKEQGIEGRSEMTKDELAKAVSS